MAGQKHKSAWLISDLITLGSPLTHAKYLLVDSFHELQMAINRREMLRCPPVLEEHRNKQFCFFFENPKDSGYWRMHHAAAMAPVRWTNIYDKPPNPYGFWLGDIISGPVSHDFGPGIADIDVKIRRPEDCLGCSRKFTHTSYWDSFLHDFNSSNEIPLHVKVLQEALNFLDDPGVEKTLLERCHWE